MFRAAEEEFEEEDLRKEAKGLLQNPEAIVELDDLREAVEKAKAGEGREAQEGPLGQEGGTRGAGP